MKERINAWIDKAKRVVGDLQDNAAGLLNN